MENLELNPEQRNVLNEIDKLLFPYSHTKRKQMIDMLLKSLRVEAEMEINKLENEAIEINKTIKELKSI